MKYSTSKKEGVHFVLTHLEKFPGARRRMEEWGVT
jgi:hypothetical protein